MAWNLEGQTKLESVSIKGGSNNPDASVSVEPPSKMEVPSALDAAHSGDDAAAAAAFDVVAREQDMSASPQSWTSEPLAPLEKEAVLEMFQTTVKYVKRQNTPGYFVLIHPKTLQELKLKRQAMISLCEHLPRAIELCQLFENQDAPDQTQLVKELASYYNNRVHLYVNVHDRRPYIWVRRFFVEDTSKALLPTTKGVLFSCADNLGLLCSFIANHK